MELLVAILIALGSLKSPADYNQNYIKTHGSDIQRAKQIINTGQYGVTDGGVIVDPGVGV